MKTAAEILDWLSQANLNTEFCLPETKDGPHRQYPISPPHSELRGRRRGKMDRSPSPEQPSKRQKTGPTGDGDDEVVELDATPRASERGHLAHRHSSAASPTKSQLSQGQIQQHMVSVALSIHSAASSRSESKASGRSSPTKKFSALELNPEGIETRVLSVGDLSLPDALFSLTVELDGCNNALGVISRSRTDEIEEQQKVDRSYILIRDTMYADVEARDRLGPTPSVEDVSWILAEARECQDTAQNEAGWNMAVHNSILHKAIYGPRRRKKLVGFAPCTTASIIKEYVPKSTNARKVDFSIYLDLEACSTNEESRSATEAVHSLRQVLPCNVINHTDFHPLRSRPIVVSVESKKRGGSQQEAELQMGIWHAAQWKLLSRLVDDAKGSFDGLPFLPGIVVNGHEWSFVASTREGLRTVLWLEQRVGSTTSVAGVYQIVWALQRIAKWAEEVYWPWFRENCLGIRD